MSLVTLIQKINSADRDAVITIDDWLLPKEAVFTGDLDEAGRKIYSIVKGAVTKVKPDVVADVKSVESKVHADVAKLEADAKTVGGDVEADIENVLHEVEGEAKSLASKIEGLFHHKANT